jgi:two-component system, NtrC family, response regulator HydG
LKILVVDDDRRIVQTTCDILKIKGYEPIPAYSGMEGVEKVRADLPDLVLMDFKMPDINGVEALKQMHLVSPALPVVLVSAYATEETIQEAKFAGAYALLSKPLNFQMVLSFLSLLHKEESILVVDDNPDLSKTLKDILLLRGYQVETEAESCNVLKHLEMDYKLTVVIDLKLDVAKNENLLEEIRSRYPSKPVVLLTGCKQKAYDSLQSASKIGAFTYLYKSFEMDGLLQLIEEIRVMKLQNFLEGK